MKLSTIQFSIIILLSIMMSGCATYSYDYETIEDQIYKQKVADYEKFKEIDETIYLYKGYYKRDSEDEVDWLNVISQNDELNTYLMKKYYDDYSIDFDFSNVDEVEGGYIELIYNDGVNPEVTKELSVEQVDVSKDEDGNSNVIPKYGGIQKIFKQYIVDFATADNDMYTIRVYSTDDEDRVYTEYFGTYTGPQTYYFNGKPVAKLWKEKLNYRIDLLDVKNNENQERLKYYVYRSDLGRRTGPIAADLKPGGSPYLRAWVVSDISYEVEYIAHHEDTTNITVGLNIVNKNSFLNIEKEIVIHSDTPKTYTEDQLDYTIEISRLKEKVVKITFESKDGYYTYPYGLEANR